MKNGKFIGFKGVYREMDKKRMAITNERKVEIENKVNEIIKKIKFKNSPTVDIVALVKKKGFIVERSEMPLDTTGCLMVDETKFKPKRVIVVNRNFANSKSEEDVVLKKSRFITAHEYGHYVLHKSLSQKLYAHRDTHLKDSLEEVEADYFARCLLMPTNFFKEWRNFYNEMSDNDEEFVLFMLSKTFCVTINKIKARINDIEGAN